MGGDHEISGVVQQGVRMEFGVASVGLKRNPLPGEFSNAGKRQVIEIGDVAVRRLGAPALSHVVPGLALLPH
jgi:hypothetical protein